MLICLWCYQIQEKDFQRDGAVDLLDYKKLGYLKEALINYLVKWGGHIQIKKFLQRRTIELVYIRGSKFLACKIF